MLAFLCMPIQYVDRSTHRILTEEVYGHFALSLLYGDGLFSRIFGFFLLPLLARFQWFSLLYGYLQKRPKSKDNIAPFIAQYKIDASEFAKADFDSFNDFFTRKLKPSSRSVIEDPSRACLPADGRYLAYSAIDTSLPFLIKGQPFLLEAFLHNRVYARRFERGAMVIARLAPVDYHRFHFPFDGVPSKPKAIDGALYSVNPIALARRLSILWHNKRVITEIESEAFGTVLFVEVGATCVGTIHQTYTADTQAAKGDEKGYFSFGGSCIVLLFEKDRIELDADLVENTKRGFETYAHFGQSLGKAKRATNRASKQTNPQS
ncbi:MAG: phosphatidylserine decarboxylase proenzyme [Chlamydiota bacterium]|jgi:phosphatidylserine decarboxylase